MNRRELKKLYDNDELDDPSELQRLRDEIATYTGLHVPRSVSEIEEWWSNNKAIFSRRIKSSEETRMMEDHEVEVEDTDDNGDSK